MVFKTGQVVENRLYTGSTDGSLRLWTLKGLRLTNEKHPENTEAVDADEAARESKVAEQ